MKGGDGIYKKEIKERYYNFQQRKEQAQKQDIILPTKEDFENTLRSLPGEYKENELYLGGNILAIILGESNYTFCNNKGIFYMGYGYLGSNTSSLVIMSRYFKYNEREGSIIRDIHNENFPCRPIVKKDN